VENEKSQHFKSYHFYKAGDWELYIFFNARGTKAEGTFGVLLKNGNVYPPGFHESEEIETALGKMKYYRLDPPNSWDPKGWLFADRSKIPRSETPKA
jgi:hypothetical protein